MPFQNNTFDFIYNSGVIEHFKDPMNVSAIKEMARVLKPTGRLLVILPNTYCLWYKVGKWVSVMMKNFEFGYEEDYSPTRLKNAIDSSRIRLLKKSSVYKFYLHLQPMIRNSFQ